MTMAKGDKKKHDRKGEAKVEKAVKPVVKAPAPAPAAPKGTAMPERKGTKVPPTDHEIRVRAQQLWEARKGHGGDPTSDWIEAERQLRAERGL